MCSRDERVLIFDSSYTAGPADFAVDFAAGAAALAAAVLAAATLVVATLVVAALAAGFFSFFAVMFHLMYVF
jgi:hypothetical protein